LGVTHGAISHQIRALEEKLGVALFIRAHNRLTLTPAGIRLHQAVKEGLDRILDGTRNLDPEQLAGPLILGCTQTIATSWAAKHICEFQKRYPTIDITVREIEPRQKAVPREIDIAICYGAPTQDDRHLSRLASPSLFPVCSPQLVSARTDGLDIENLRHVSLIHDKQVSWDRWFAAHGLIKSDKIRNIIFANTSQALTAARLGYGVALCNDFETQDYIREGQLIRLSDKSIPEEKDYFLLTPSSGRRSAKTQIFEEWIVRACRPEGSDFVDPTAAQE
jgi:LysR family glycine cleavage system transcriptional activator